jgi:hypothetical protein
MPGERRYGKVHRKTRESYRPDVEAGLAVCSRCMTSIAPPGEPCPRCGKVVARGRPASGQCGWDTGHDDYDGTAYTGPEHGCCNRRAGGRRGGRSTARKRQAHVWSRQWLS